MIESKEFTYEGENYKAILFKNYKQYGWFVVLKHPLILDAGTHKRTNKVYKMNVLNTDRSNIDTFIELWKRTETKKIWENRD